MSEQHPVTKGIFIVLQAFRWLIAGNSRRSEMGGFSYSVGSKAYSCVPILSDVIALSVSSWQRSIDGAKYGAPIYSGRDDTQAWKLDRL